MKLLAPEFLKKGDKVALIAPASFIEEESVIKAEELLTLWGLLPVRGNNLLVRYGSFAGTDEERLNDLQQAFDDNSVKAIWAVRGGYGVTRIIESIDFKAFSKSPKWVIGFSDITALHNVLHNKGFMSIHALMPVQLHADVPVTEAAISSLKNALFGENIKHVLPGCTMGKTGSISGTLVGGNLSLLESLTGTNYQLKTRGKILFIEEVGEPLYKIDRMMQSLKLAGCFKGLKGLIIGGITGIEDTETPYGKTYHNIISDAVSDYSFPVLFDVLAGHTPDNRALVFGEDVIINIGEFISCIRFDLEK